MGHLVYQKNCYSWCPNVRLKATRGSQKVEEPRVEHVAEELHAGVSHIPEESPDGEANSYLLGLRASFLSGSTGEPVIHDCLEAIKATYSSCPDLKETLPENTETWSTDGSSYVISGRHAGKSGVKEEGAQGQVLEEMALANANEQYKAAILNLSIEPVPALDDMLQFCLSAKVTRCDSKDPVTRETKSPHDQVTWGRGYAYVSTPPGLKWVTAEWVKPFIPKTAKTPCRGPTSGQCCLEEEKAPNLLILIIIIP
ncbi:hypothetical protein DUI87_01178 [Hirundo rustica rustica]|uniref:Integrase-type domain-containing protein n=1 Tax=Hirundo rustica rustica TaxID=333673 RepID=A0A3M0L454_HIRRU|nr:hypothetical protein DUI87_01178 [Hirundo rustica rustica]